MADEKRRFFRINEHIGLSYERLDQREAEMSAHTVADLEVLIGSQTDRIDQLLADVAAESPKVAALVQAQAACLFRRPGDFQFVATHFFFGSQYTQARLDGELDYRQFLLTHSIISHSVAAQR